MHFPSSGDRLEANLDAILRSRAPGGRTTKLTALMLATGVGAALLAWHWQRPPLPPQAQPNATLVTPTMRPAPPLPESVAPSIAVSPPAAPVASPPVAVAPPPVVAPPVVAAAAPAPATAYAFRTLRERSPMTRRRIRPASPIHQVPPPQAPAPSTLQADDAPTLLAARDTVRAPRAPIEPEALAAAEPQAALPPPAPVRSAADEPPARAKAKRQESLDLIRALRRQ